MKKVLTGLISLSVFLVCDPVFGATTQPTGAVTPTSVTITVTGVNAIDENNSYSTISSTQTEVTFTRTDSNMANVKIADFSIPQGRYIGISISYLAARKIKLDGVYYQGADGTGFTASHGAKLWSTADVTDGLAVNSVTTTLTATPSTLTLVPTKADGTLYGATDKFASITYFSSPFCVTKDTSICKTGDTIVDGNSQTPSIGLLLDMFHNVGIDGRTAQMSLDNHYGSYPYAVANGAGAAIHLTATNGLTGNDRSISDATLLFDSSKKLIYAQTAATGNGLGSSSGWCSGVAAVTATGAPSGSQFNKYGPTFVMTFDSTTGVAKFAAPGNGTASYPSGVMAYTDLLKAVGQTTTSTCVADDLATPPYLGYTYNKGTGVAGSTNWTISRIVDPTGIFGKCTSTATGFITGTGSGGGGSCKDPAITNADGYP